MLLCHINIPHIDFCGSSNAARFHATHAEVHAYYKAQEIRLNMARKIGKSFILLYRLDTMIMQLE